MRCSTISEVSDRLRNRNLRRRQADKTGEDRTSTESARFLGGFGSMQFLYLRSLIDIVRQLGRKNPPHRGTILFGFILFLRSSECISGS